MLLGGVSAHGMTKKHHHSSTPLIGHHKKKGKKGKEPLILLPSSLRGWIVCICVSQLVKIRASHHPLPSRAEICSLRSLYVGCAT